MYVYTYDGHAHIFLNALLNILYTNTYTYITHPHINPVCEETLGPLVLEYIYVTENTPNVCFVFLLRPDPPTIYIYVHMYMYIYMHVYSIVYIYIYLCMYVCVYMSACVHKKHIYTHICMYVCIYIYACMYTNTMDMHIYF